MSGGMLANFESRLRAKPMTSPWHARRIPPPDAGKALRRRAVDACPVPQTGGSPRMTEHTLVLEALHLPKREAQRWRHMRLDQEDLVADGYLGLARAARRYDPSHG